MCEQDMLLSSMLISGKLETGWKGEDHLEYEQDTFYEPAGSVTQYDEYIDSDSIEDKLETESAPASHVIQCTAEVHAEPEILATNNTDVQKVCPAETSTKDEITVVNEDFDPELLRALGEFEADSIEWGENIHEEIAKHFQHTLLNGLKKEAKEELHKTPTLNPEIAAMLTEASRNRDKRILAKQEQIGKALSASCSIPVEAVGTEDTLTTRPGTEHPQAGTPHPDARRRPPPPPRRRGDKRRRQCAVSQPATNIDPQFQIAYVMIYGGGKNILTGTNPIQRYNYVQEIFTDASTTGWGAASNGEKTGGQWTDIERKNHINYLELLAVYFGLKSFADDKCNCNILLRVDNTTAISYINRMGGVQYPHLNYVAKMIWKWCEERRIFIFASYIKSSLNVEADRESRKINIDGEWELQNKAFIQVAQKPIHRCIDTLPGSECVIRESFIKKGVPESALNVILSSITQSTKSHLSSLSYGGSIVKKIRSNKDDKLLLTNKKPRPASSQTIGRWIKQVLQESGINPNIFGAHSTRHATTSAASRAGISVEVIRKAAGWSDQSAVFANFYNRPVVDKI
ncbi:hypothetical protein MSG28_009993 [Choristoneura fumiferana]|uniref:Uncharacterized protein n=1 Tax=Choristoneura fumiferana TaxID=7141 RepID=A0ACC0JD92_CHOFU|nr:hypothetical protein MSG28_009993 [Choristoneura fumiferana]